jgi:hypothetical protein
MSEQPTTMELRRLHSELHMNKRANEIWEEKTAWVQDTALPRELGMHRADVLKDRIDRLKRAKAELLESLKDALFHVANQGDVGVDQWLACERKARNVIAKMEGA